MRRRIVVFILAAIAMLPGCGEQTGSEAFLPPEIVSSEASVAGRKVVLTCTLSEPRAEKCGFRWWTGGETPSETQCGLTDNSFSLELRNLDKGVSYEWYAFATAGESEIRSEVKTFVLDLPDEPAKDEFWYVTRSGKTVGVKEGMFDVPVISNTYNDGLGVISFDGTLTVIGMGAFYLNEDLAEIVIPSGVRELAYSCFRECLNLTKVTICPGLERVGDTAFHNCQTLSTLILPETVKCIDKDAFSHCFSLSSVDLPEELDSLGQSAFLNCTSLREIVIPKTVTSIGYRAFDGDYSLERIVCLAEDPPVGAGQMFKGSDAPIYVPAGSVELYKAAEFWRTYSSRIVSLEEQ